MNADRIILSLLALLAVAGCANTVEPPPRVIRESSNLARDGRAEEAIARLEKALAAAPSDPELRTALFRLRETELTARLQAGEQALQEGRLDVAQGAFESAFLLEPRTPRGAEGLRRIEVERRLRQAVAEGSRQLQAGDIKAAERAVGRVLAERPNFAEARRLSRRIADEQSRQAGEAGAPLNPVLAKPITLEFKDATLGSVFEVISRTSGVNFVFDKDVRPDTKVNIFVRNNSIDDVIRLLLVTNQLERKVLNDNSMLIYPNSPAKAKDYQELVVRAFYLASADAKQTLVMLKTLAKSRDVFVDEKLNMVVIRDTPEAVRLAERLIRAQDLAEPEVLLDLEVLEVGRSRLDDLGVKYPSQVLLGSATSASGTTGGGTTTTLDTGPIHPLSHGLTWLVGNPVATFNLTRTDGQTRILSNPRIRVKNKGQAKVHIGEKVPVVTTTSTANVGVSASVSYLDTGLKLDVEPTIYLDDEIGIKLSLEVSSILETIDISGTRTYRLGTRNAATSLRLHDGETQILAGLIDDQERRNAAKVPGLADLPIVGRLFRNDNNNATKTEIILLMTPRVVHNIERPEGVEIEFPSGTEAAAGAAPLRVRPMAPGSLSVGLPRSGPGARVAASLPPVAPSVAAPPVAAAEAAPPPAPAGAQAQLTGPSLVGYQEEFQVRVAIPASAATQAQMQVNFDPALWQFVGSPVAVSADGGTLTVRLALSAGKGGSVDLRFKAVGPAGSHGELGVSNLLLRNESAGVPMQAPTSLELAVGS